MGGGPVAAIGRFAELATIRVDDGVVVADWAAGLTMQRIQLGIEASACPSRGRRNADKGRPRPSAGPATTEHQWTEEAEGGLRGRRDKRKHGSQSSSQPPMVTVRAVRYVLTGAYLPS